MSSARNGGRMNACDPAALPRGDAVAEEPCAEMACDGADGPRSASPSPPAENSPTRGAIAAVAAAPVPAPPMRGEQTQVIVPVSSACTSLTPRLLSRTFSISGETAQQLLLALVDSHGAVTRSCLYNYIQSPLEGPGTADLELLDD